MSTGMMKSIPSAPKVLRLQAIQALEKAGIEPSPENLLKMSKRKKHPLHAFFWDTPDEVWAQVGRYEGARRIINTTRVEFSIGGKTLEVRAVEFVRTDDGGRWAMTQDIVKSPELLSGYMREIESLNEQAAEKMRKLREIISG